jgi:hypothetical protein
MAVFFIDTQRGQVATQKQLIAAGIANADGDAPAPWHPIRGAHDATTMWYAVMRREERGIFIGSLVFRHTPHHDLLLQRGWQEVPVDEIGVPGVPGAAPAADQAM